MCLKERYVTKPPTEYSMSNHIDLDLAWNDNCTYTDYDDFISHDKQDTDLTVLQLNVRGLINKQTELKNLLYRKHTNKVDVALLCETWIRPKNVNRVHLSDYVFESKERKGKRGSGIGILIRNNLKYRRRKDLEIDCPNIETIVIELRGNKENTLLMSCYRAPNMNQKEFISLYQCQIEKLKERILPI